MRQNQRVLVLLAACGAAAGVTHGQTLINISGATLLENFQKGPASTNDYFDVDGDGCSRLTSLCTDQLAPFALPPTGGSQHWIVQYRATGSVRGFQELIDFHGVFVDDDCDNCGDIRSNVASKAFHNRRQYISNGAESDPIYNAGNPGGAPVRADELSLLATYTTPDNPSPGGIRIDIAIVDVSSRFASIAEGGDPAWNRDPGVPGYGDNDRLSVNKDGSTFFDGEGNPFGHKLADLGDLNLFDPTDPGSADDKTIFDTPIAFAPIAPVVNFGVGRREVKQSDLRHMFLTGRSINGENLMIVTRDSGSGTRNGWCNSIGIDPSWGVGENIGGLSNAPDEQILGPLFIPSNKNGNSEVERTTRNHRLGLGYAGAERGINSGWLTGGQLEILAVNHDLSGASPTDYSRPNIDEVLDNGPNGWNLGGSAVYATVGDPQAAPPSKGGTSSGLPAMRNVEAAAYLNNLTLSIEAFVDLPGSDETLFTPGELAATQLILVAATDFVQDQLDPTTLIPNPDFNGSLQEFTRLNNVLRDPGYYTFGTYSVNGINPTRKTGVTYSDGVVGGGNYISQGGASLSYGAACKPRNRISGDFNGDAKRDLNDVTEMLEAYIQRTGGAPWVAPTGTGDIAGAPGTDACIEILGDFNGDGNFDIKDIRYWCDGLAIDPATGALNRFKGFQAVDNAWLALTGSNNFFGTTLGSGAAYTPGDSSGDVASSGPGPFGNHTPGFAPIGHDGVIDAADVGYIESMFIGNPDVTDGVANWDNVFEAVAVDLSCDFDGDLDIDAADAAAVEDLADGCYGDYDGNGSINTLDFIAFLNDFNDGVVGQDDCDGNGTINTLDFICFLNAFNAGCP